MKKLAFIFLIFFCINGKSQSIDSTKEKVVGFYGITENYVRLLKSLLIMNTDSTDKTNNQIRFISGTPYYVSNGIYKKFAGSVPDSGIFVTYYGGDNRYFTLQPQDPTATICCSYDYEYMTGSTFSGSVDWTAGRLAGGVNLKATDSIATVYVNSISRTFTQPSPGSSYSATTAVTININTTQVIPISVTTTSGKSAGATVTIRGLPKNYFGYSENASPDQTIVLAVSGGGNYLSTSKANTPTVTIPSGSAKYVYYAYPVTYGALTSIKDGAGNEVIGAFTRTTVSITNQSSAPYTQNYYVYTSNNNYSNTSIYVNYN